MEKARKFQDLVVWKKAHEFVLMIYELTTNYPKNEQYGLVQQMRRAAVSVAANIAEGFSRNTNKEKTQFYRIAYGSLEETRCYLILSKDLCYLKTIDKYETPAMEVSRMLSRLINSLKTEVPVP